MNEFQLLSLTARFLDYIEVPYFVTGSVASNLYGEIRFTNDIDIVADFNLDHVKLILLKFSPPDFYCSAMAIEEAILNRSMFNVIHVPSGLKIDFIVPARDEFEKSRMSRRSQHAYTEQKQASFSSAEDLILKKLLFYQEGNSDKHLRDIISMLKSSKTTIDFNYLRSWAIKLGITQLLEHVIKESHHKNGNV